ncbi:MAG TPA: phenylalanine--tRNA ligase subunit beta [Bacteroidota bacterium]|nr:phenylalanine--tRNA ligase subunit beta [Bacteroidota bacterium]
MRISFNWLSKYIKLKISPEKLAEKLTSVGLEVESIERLGGQFDNFVVGEIVSVRKHTNADKLTVCLVSVGKKRGSTADDILQIVCGAPNVTAGQKVAVGLVGAVVPRNQHDPAGKPFTLGNVKIRGEESSGMICSEYELGIGEDANGILVLDPSAKVGASLAKHFGLDDVVFEIGITPNRPDCLSHIGIAREAAAILKGKVELPRVHIRENAEQISKEFSVDVRNPEGCPRYSARLVTGVVVAPSPQWLQASLKSVGLRPINNVVDVTNFVMFEFGQPLHAFDGDLIHKKKIIVRNASDGEKFVTLDGIERTLTASTLMIWDADRPIAIAGVMGGMNSEISASTTSVFLESAFFNPSSVRKTAKRLGILSDAAFRFERGTDPNTTVDAVDRAASMLAEIAGGQVHRGVIDVYPKKIKDRRVRLRTERVNKLLGTNISAPSMKKMLASIGISTQSKSKGVMLCTVPTFRPDIEQEIDLVEEVARLHGYTKIEDKMMSNIDFSHRSSHGDALAQLRNALCGLGFNEVVTNSLIDQTLVKPFSPNVVEIKNPISKDLSALRPSTVFSMLQAVYHNINYGNGDLKLFEIGRTYEKVAKEIPTAFIQGYKENGVISVCMTGKRNTVSWNSSGRSIDIYDLKGVVQALLDKILLDKFQFIYYDSRSPLTEETIVVEKDGTYVGFLGKVKADLLKKFSVESDVYVSELSISELVQTQKKFKMYVPPTKFPSVRRDLAFIVAKDVLFEAIERQVVLEGGHLLKGVTLFDVFEGKPLPEGKKSFAISVELNSAEKTLTEDEAAKVIDRVVKGVSQAFGAELRSSS